MEKRELIILVSSIIFICLILIYFPQARLSPKDKIIIAEWVTQDSGDSVYIESKLYDAKVDNETGLVKFFDKNGTFLMQTDFTINTINDTIKKEESTPSIEVDVTDGIAIVTLNQSTEKVNFSSEITFYNEDGKVVYKEILGYNSNQKVNEEKFILSDGSSSHIFDDGENEANCY